MSRIKKNIPLRLLFQYIQYLKYKHRYRGKVRFKGFTYIYAFPGSSIDIGEGTCFNNYSISNVIGLYQRTIIHAKYGGQIKIGKRCGISGTTIYSLKSITIGDDVMIGANCKIIDNDMHPLDFEDRINNCNGNIKKKPVVIEAGCFIGMNSIILKGTHLGKRCIVGAGSVLCGTFPDDVIIAGNPAKIIKKNNK